MKSASSQNPQVLRLLTAGMLGWLVPGAGHLYIGERTRGLVFLVVIALTFWGGIAIGGVKNTVNPNQRALWFLGQICAGAHPMLAVAWSRQIDIPEDADKARWISYGQVEEIGVVYTAICGMLNILIIFDVLTRLEHQFAGVPAGRASP